MSEAAKKQPTVPEDETFLSEEEVFEQAYNEKHGLQAKRDAEPEPERRKAEDNETEEPQRFEGETSEREEGESEKAGEDDTPAWMNDMPEEARAAYEHTQKELAALRNQYNAVHNRLAPVQQENARLRQRLSGNSSSPAQPTNSQAAPVGQSRPSAGFSLDDVEEFQEFREAFPDEAKAMEAAFARQSQHVGDLESRLAQLQEVTQTIQQSSYETARERELYSLQEAHPDWATVRPSDDFNDWLQHQPESVASMANSAKAADCIWVLDRYKMDVHLAQQYQQGTAEEQPQGDNRAQQTRDRRQRLRSVPNPRPQQDGGVGAPQMGGIPISEEEMWEQEVQRRLRAQREANR